MPIAPTTDELAFASSAIDAIVERVHSDLPYARIDLVADDGTGPVLMEAELIDPSLSLWAKAEAATLLARAVITQR